MAIEFKTGDVVTLKSGGAKMTVRYVGKSVIGIATDGTPVFDLTHVGTDPDLFYIECHWLDGSGKINKECFFGSMLSLVSELGETLLQNALSGAVTHVDYGPGPWVPVGTPEKKGGS